MARAVVEELHTLRAMVLGLATEIAELRRAEEPTPAPYSWLDAGGTHRDQAQVLFTLADWVRRIYLRYADAQRLPDCWLWHPEIVEELLWLQDAWRGAYGPDAPIFARGDWHDKSRPGVVDRISLRYIGQGAGCSFSKHTDGQTTIRPATLDDTVLDIARWWATDPRGTGPEPSLDQLAEVEAHRRRTRQ